MRTLDFRRLWISSATGALGGWMAQVALFVAILTRHGVTSLAWVTLVGALPPLFTGPFLGAAVDRWDPGRTSRLAGIGQAIAVAAVAALLGRALAMAAVLYATANLLGAIANPARQRLLYQVVPPRDRAWANARIGSATGIVTVVGAAMGGTVALIGAAPALLIAAAIRLCGAILLFRVRPALGSVRPTAAAEGRESYWRSLAEGFAAVRRYPAATSVLLVGIARGLIGGSYDVLLTDYGASLLHGGAMGVGALYATDGLGVVAGTLLAGRFSGRWRGPAYGMAYMLQGAFWTLFALSHALAVGVPLLFAMRLASGVIIAWDTTLLLETVPDGLHGRIFSLHAATCGGVMRVSLAVTGVLLAVVGVRAIAIAAGIGSLAVGLTWWLAAGRHRPGGEPQQVQAAVEVRAQGRRGSRPSHRGWTGAGEAGREPASAAPAAGRYFPSSSRQAAISGGSTSR